MKGQNLDETDRRILHAVQVDSARSQRDLAEAVGLSQNALWRRLKALEADGVIAGYTARIDRQAAGKGLTVFALLRSPTHSADWLRRFRAHVETIPEVTGFYRIGGQYDYLLKIVTDDVSGYDRVYQRLVERIELADVTALFAMEAIFEDRPLPL